MSAYTLGPWRLVVSQKGWMNPYQIERADGACLFSFGESPFHANAEADAHLIAAAPDLLAALELYVGENKRHTERERKDIALAAIAKAKGGAK